MNIKSHVNIYSKMQHAMYHRALFTYGQGNLKQRAGPIFLNPPEYIFRVA